MHRLPHLLAALMLPLFVTLPVWAQDREATLAEVAAQEPPPGIAAAGTESLSDQQVADNEKVWLQVAGAPELALYLSAASGDADGGVILLPGLAQHPATRDSTIDTLRIALSENHWHTLALNTGNADEDRAAAVIAAGVNYLNQRGVYNIAVVGEGWGAAQSIHYASTITVTNKTSGQLTPVKAIVMIDADNLKPESKKNMLEILTAVEIPILDAYSNGDYQQQRLANERKHAARNKINRGYQQIRLPKNSLARQHVDNRITRRIRGWLNKHVAGL